MRSTYILQPCGIVQGRFTAVGEPETLTLEGAYKRLGATERDAKTLVLRLTAGMYVGRRVTPAGERLFAVAVPSRSDRATWLLRQVPDFEASVRLFFEVVRAQRPYAVVEESSRDSW